MRQVMVTWVSPVQRIVGIPRIVQRAEARLQSVIEKQASDQALTNREQLLHHLHRLQGPHHAGDGTENTGLRTWRDGSGGRCVGKQTAIAGARIAVSVMLEGADCGEITVERTDRRRDQRALGEMAGIVDQVACGEIVRAVGNDVVMRDNLDSVLWLKPRGIEARLYVRVQALKTPRRASGLEGAHA